MANYMELSEKEEEISQAKESLLKRVVGNEKLEVFWWKMCADVSILRFKYCKCQIDEILAAEPSLLPSMMPTVQGYSAGECDETPTLSQNKVGEQVVREFLVFDQK